MGRKFVCPLCGNRDETLIGNYLGVPYCLKCLVIKDNKLCRTSFKGTPPPTLVTYYLSKEQAELSERIVENFKNGKNTLLYAVCGSGKTEVSYGVIQYAMSLGLNVGFALPRRDVVIELYERLKKAFPFNKIVAVYGGHVHETSGDCIVLTTHQLFRYPDFFDLLVMDEVDAFPYAGNQVLENDFKESLRGHCLLMSATPSKALVKEFSQNGNEVLLLHTRFHRHPIPVPKTVLLHGKSRYSFIIAKLLSYRKNGNRTFIFVPSVEMSEIVYRILSAFCPNGNYVSSKRIGREEIIEDFKNGKYDFLVTTAILERGVTVKNLNVIVLCASSRIYDAASLVQIAGRAGRKIDAPYGDVYFVSERRSEAIEKAISEIEYCNTFLHNLSRKD